MIIVTGTARSRTSLTMAILERLGIRIVRDKSLDVFPEANKNGLYEVKDDSIHGTYKDYGYKSAMKIVLGGLFPSRFNNFKGTPTPILNNCKIIFCLRKPIEIAQSIKKMDSRLNIEAKYILWEYGQFLMGYNDSITAPIMFVDTNSYFMNPEQTALDIARFIDVTPIKSQIDGIRSYINPKETIIGDIKWPEEIEREGRVVDNIYHLLYNGDITSAQQLFFSTLTSR